MILIVSPNKPLPRAGKGTIKRKAALLSYAEEIDAMCVPFSPQRKISYAMCFSYAEVDATVESEGIDPPSSWDLDTTAMWIQKQVEDIHSGRPFNIASDLFDQGMDRYFQTLSQLILHVTDPNSVSLGATILRRRIVNALKSDLKTQKASQLVTQSTVYSHPSINKLSEFLVGVIADPDTFALASNKVDAIESMITKYSTGLSEPIPSGPSLKPIVEDAVVLLTGSTGNLGAQLLESLLRDSRVKTVYTLDRPSSGTKTLRDRQAERFADKGLDLNLLNSPRLVALQGEASQANLGLDPTVYNEVRES